MRPVRVEQNVFERRSSLAVQALPLVDGNEDGGFYSAARDHLRTVFERGVEWTCQAMGESSFSYSHMTISTTFSGGSSSLFARMRFAGRGARCGGVRIALLPIILLTIYVMRYIIS